MFAPRWASPLFLVAGLPLTIAATHAAPAAGADSPTVHAPYAAVGQAPADHGVSDRDAIRALLASQPKPVVPAAAPAKPVVAPAKPVARPAVAPRPPAPKPVTRPAPPPPPPVVHASGPTGWGALNDAIARIPNYRPGLATWVVSDKYGHYGATDFATDTVYISPSVPENLLFSVAVHEWSHVLQGVVYNRDWTSMENDLNAWYGASGTMGLEYAADCMAIQQGATWTHYTSCQDPHWRDGAARLLAGQRL